MGFTFARATRGRVEFAVFASPDEPVRRDQRDAAPFRSRRSSRVRSKVVALGNRTVVTGAGKLPDDYPGNLVPAPCNPVTATY
jgi:hypothetical protein